jgi:hypothetical protein
MNISRGMFRLWVAISALWVAVVCVTFWDQLSEIFTAVEPPKGQGAVALSLEDYACWATRNSDNPFIYPDPGHPDWRTLVQAWRTCILYKAQVPAIALGPPLAVLALGFVIRWIAKGFQRTI